MPFVGEKERLIIFSKKEWEKLPEFNFGSWVEKEDGVEIQERRIIIHNVQLLVNRLTYTIIDLSVTPQYLGECKYRG